MDILTEPNVNKILTDINEIIWDDNLSDEEALKEIVNILKKNNITTESVINEKKQVTTICTERTVIKQEKMM